MGLRNRPEVNPKDMVLILLVLIVVLLAIFELLPKQEATIVGSEIISYKIVEERYLSAVFPDSEYTKGFNLGIPVDVAEMDIWNWLKRFKNDYKKEIPDDWLERNVRIQEDKFTHLLLLSLNPEGEIRVIYEPFEDMEKLKPFSFSLGKSIYYAFDQYHPNDKGDFSIRLFELRPISLVYFPDRDDNRRFFLIKLKESESGLAVALEIRK